MFAFLLRKGKLRRVDSDRPIEEVFTEVQEEFFEFLSDQKGIAASSRPSVDVDSDQLDQAEVRLHIQNDKDAKVASSGYTDEVGKIF